MSVNSSTFLKGYKQVDTFAPRQQPPSAVAAATGSTSTNPNGNENDGGAGEREGQVQERGGGEGGEWEDETEEIYVTLDLGTVEPTLLPSCSTLRLIGLDTPTPYLQLAGTVFKGKHEELLGTELLFSDTEDRRHVVHVGNSGHRIRFREVELRAKDSVVDMEMERMDVVDGEEEEVEDVAKGGT